VAATVCLLSFHRRVAQGPACLRAGKGLVAVVCRLWYIVCVKFARRQVIDGVHPPIAPGAAPEVLTRGNMLRALT